MAQGNTPHAREREVGNAATATSSHFLSRHLAQASLPLAPSLTTNHIGGGAAGLASEGSATLVGATAVTASAASTGSNAANAATADGIRLRASSNTGTLPLGDHAAFGIDDVHPTFSPHVERAGDVLLRARAAPHQDHSAGSPTSGTSASSAQYVDFYCHRDVLWFASPFFRNLLQGQWKETTEALTRADADGDGDSNGDSNGVDDDTDSHDQGSSPSVPELRASFHTAVISLEADELPHTQQRTLDILEGRRDKDKSMLMHRMARLATPPDDGQNGNDSISMSTSWSSRRRTGMTTRSKSFTASRSHRRQSSKNGKATPPSGQRSSAGSNTVRRKPRRQAARESHGKSPEQWSPHLKAVIELPDEDASTVEGALRHVYPHLDLTVTWRNCARLLAFADKYDICGLRRVCVDFLRASLAGRPILALKIADDASLKDIYKESSRHVMDAWPNWEPSELAILSQETLLKLERKRTWFLERLLKLGLASPGRDFLCQPNCPDPDGCARTLQERWQNALSASFRFGPPTPSAVWRHLRELEGVAPVGVRELAACHNASGAYIALLFDRMFNLPSGLAGHPKFLTIKLE